MGLLDADAAAYTCCQNCAAHTHILCICKQEDLDEEECPEGFKLSGAVPEAQPDSEAMHGAAAGRHPIFAGESRLLSMLDGAVIPVIALHAYYPSYGFL